MVVITRISTQNAFALDDRDVAINRNIAKALDFTAGLRPQYLQPFDLLLFSQAEHHPGIVRREIASAANLGASSYAISRFVADLRPDGVNVRLLPHQLHTQPMVLRRGAV